MVLSSRVTSYGRKRGSEESKTKGIISAEKKKMVTYVGSYPKTEIAIRTLTCCAYKGKDELQGRIINWLKSPKFKC